jgi:hypothetical protein
MNKPRDAIRLLVGYFLIAIAISVPLFAAATAAPEIDAGIVGSAAALLVGGYLVVVSRARRK